ncbi:hypothetical protein [Sulfurovum sp.]|uniref:tetratricopeptide repeat protein n=1 Tax=Sulfurovum sp. TaxID=1969726 RepID=UPI002868079E|nr:hypothetical protein [Sulfurovum sp.]
MNQTKKRLSIINYAISITDIETIQLQVSKLRMLKTDEKIQEIIAIIEEENYAQAQRLIALYIEMPIENILQRTSQTESTARNKEDQAIIDEFDLFIIPSANKKVKNVDINNFFTDTPVMKVKHAESIDFDALLNMNADNVLADNIEIDITYTSKDAFFEVDEEKDAHTPDTGDISKDAFFETQEDTAKEEILSEEMAKEEVPLAEETEKEEEAQKQPTKETEIIVTNDIFSQNDLFKELKPKLKVQNQIINSLYKAIPYIEQKISSMKKQYPATVQTDEHFDSVENLLKKISQEGYSEKEIEETLNYIKELSEKNKYAEAAQLLLICAATESQFSQFMLARELFKGILLTKNTPESFAHMSSLAVEDYPEALCDLAQFYEYGIGTAKDIKKAEQLYKEATEAGITRAEKHYARLKKQNKGFFKL